MPHGILWGWCLWKKQNCAVFESVVTYEEYYVLVANTDGSEREILVTE
jgi:hypothetical protein